MSLSSALRGCRCAMPLGAFLALATLASVLAAEAQIACTRQLSFGPAVAALPGMDMSSMPMTSGTVSLCPVVLVLSIAAIVLTLNAIVVLFLDRGRNAVSRSVATFVLCAPFARTCACIFTLGCGAVGTMMTIDGTLPQGPAAWLSVAGVVIATAVAASIVAIGFARCIIDLTRDIVLALERAIQIIRRVVAQPHTNRRQSMALVPVRLPVLTASRGLRAPPFVR